MGTTETAARLGRAGAIGRALREDRDPVAAVLAVIDGREPPSRGAEFLAEAGQHLTRAQGLLERAADELGAPTDEPFRMFGQDLQRLRRRIRNASTTATTRKVSGG